HHKPRPHARALFPYTTPFRSRNSLENLRNLYIRLPNGNQIPLREVADIDYQSGPMQISRDNTNRRVYVGINVRGRDVQSLAEEIDRKSTRLNSSHVKSSYAVV